MGYGFKTGSGGGATGAKLTVNSPAGSTVTVSKDGKTKTRVADSSGVAVFKGLSTGDWTVTSTDGSKTATKTVTITADYATMITFFKATINVTYPAGSVCTTTDGVTTLTAPDTSGSWACEVPNAGTWTITVVDKGWTDIVEITEENQTVDVYLDKYYLFRLGNDFKHRTGGWTVYKPTTTGELGWVGFYGENIVINPAASDYCYTAVRPNNLIDLTNFSKLEVNFLEIYPAHSQYNATTIEASTSGIASSGAVCYVYNTGTCTLDVSSLTGLYYVFVNVMRQETEAHAAVFNMVALS